MLGVALATPALLLQAAFAVDMPIWFAPSLVVVSVAAWRGGLAAGIAAMVEAALGVNFLLLKPIMTWSYGRPELFATFAFTALSSAVLLSAAAIRGRVEQLHLAQLESDRVARDQAQRLAGLATDYEQRFLSLQRDCDAAKRDADSYERLERYANVIAERLGELQIAIQEFPVALALVSQEYGVPVLRAASVAWCGPETGAEMTGSPGLGLFVTARGTPFEQGRHPLERAMNGERVAGEIVGWVNHGRLQNMCLYAKPVVQGSMLAVAMVPVREAELRRMRHH